MFKKLLFIILVCLISLDLSACSSFEQTSSPSSSEEDMIVEPSPEEESFYDYAKQYNAIERNSFYDDVHFELEFTSEILKKYKNAVIADYYLVFDDIISNPDGGYIGISDMDYYYIPEAFYNNIIEHDGVLDGVVCTLKNITPIYQPLYIYGESEIDVYSYDEDDFYGNVDINADISYSLSHKYEFEIIDIYFEEKGSINE